MAETDYIKVAITGGYTLISIADADKIKGYNWFVCREGYATAFTYNGKVSSIRLHQLIAGKQNGLIIDHTNRVRLDNRRSNLEHVTYKQSSANRGEQIKGVDTPYTQSELRQLKLQPANPVSGIKYKDLRVGKIA